MVDLFQNINFGKILIRKKLKIFVLNKFQNMDTSYKKIFKINPKLIKMVVFFAFYLKANELC